MGQMLDRVRENNNQFWESARQLHLDGFLGSVYRSGPKKELIKQWLRGGVKRVLIRQKDFDSDPLLIEFRRDGFEIRVIEGGEKITAEVVIEATHKAIICDSSEFRPCVWAWLKGEIKVPRLWSWLADHYLAARIFLEDV